MKKVRRMLVSAVLALGILQLASPAHAEFMKDWRSLPSGVSFMAPTEIWRMYSGNSQDWGGGSFAYWGSDQTFRAVDSAGQSLGVGKWFVTNMHKMCYRADWYWLQDFKTAKKTSTICQQFAKDAQGRIWHRETNENRNGGWLPFDDTTFIRGDPSLPAFQKLQAQLGLTKSPKSKGSGR